VTVNLRNDWQSSTLDLLVEVTRSMIDAPPGVARATQEQWSIIKQLAGWVEETAKNNRGYLDNISNENKNKLELVKRRMKLLSTELDPQVAEVRLCQIPNPKFEGELWCILEDRHLPDVAHIDQKGGRWPVEVGMRIR
jgi:hypothetical protein